jgi:L-fuculose-phosphate aldolase
MTSPFSVKNELIQIGQRLLQRGYIAGADGNISFRLEEDRILITPSGLNKGRLSPDQLVIVSLDGKRLQGHLSPSTEMAMHLYIFRQRPEVNACVHAHPPYATAFAVAGKRLPDNVLPEVVLCVGALPLTEYAPPGTEAVPEAIAPFVADANAFLLRNHGLLTIGGSLEEAYNRHETVEHFAHIVHLAHQLGNINHIPQDDFKRLEEIRRSLASALRK